MAVTVSDGKKKRKIVKSKTMPFDRKVEAMHDSIGPSTAVDVQELGYEEERMSDGRRFLDDEVLVRSGEESSVSAIVMLREAESCSDPITEYALRSSGHKRPPSELTENVRKHLSYLGWRIEFTNKDMPRYRYFSPQGKTYQSLRQVCLDLGGPAMGTDSQIFPVEQKILCSLDNDVPESQVSEQEKTRPHHGESISDTIDIEREYCPHAVIEYYSLGLNKKDHRRKESRTSNLIAKAKKHLSFMGWVFWYAYKKEKRELRYCSPKGRCYYSLRTACKACMNEGGASEGASMQIINVSEESEVRKLAPAMIDVRIQKNMVQQNPESEMPPVKSSSRSQFKSRGRKRHVDNYPAPVPKAKVHCSRQKDPRTMARGKIARSGINSNCCQELLSAFPQSEANVFLEDGGSLLQWHMQTAPGVAGETSNGLQLNNDDICSVCHYGGDLVLCDKCPSSFHQSCLGLKELPEGDWFCPPCCCRICGENKFDECSEEDKYILSCHQCELQYHVGCVRKHRHVKLQTYPDGTWFCSTQCEKIFLSFQKLLGKPIPVGVDNLTWTLVKPTISERFDMDVSDIEASKEVYSKLNTAVSIMHECFEPIKDPRTGRDLVENVIFCRGSDLKRLNFQGFYTVLLERNDVVISVATIRVYGGKVAEIPLVGTQSQYRRLGMCRILINEIEKKLMELGVERLSLPAAPNVVDTWVTSFGFSKMTDSERLRFLDYTLLDFQDAVMCQKLLMKIPSTNSSQSTGPWLKHNIEFDRHSPESEVLQAEPVEEAAIVSEGTTNTTSRNGSNGSKSTASPATQLTDFEWKQYIDEDMLELLLKDDNIDEYSLEALLKDDYHDENNVDGLLKDDDHDHYSLEGLLKDGDCQEHGLSGFLKDDKHETSRHNGDGH